MTKLKKCRTCFVELTEVEYTTSYTWDEESETWITGDWGTIRCVCGTAIDHERIEDWSPYLPEEDEDSSKITVTVDKHKWGCCTSTQTGEVTE